VLGVERLGRLVEPQRARDWYHVICPPMLNQQRLGGGAM
jgi:hypothetical protein